MKRWQCQVCGHIHTGDSPPESCPVCGAPRAKFQLMEPESLTSLGPKPTTLDADVIVVGSGAAAFAAAVTARSNGASVIMLEKAAHTGGTTARSGGGFWVPMNRWQLEAGYDDNRDAALRYMARYSYPHLYNPDAKRLGLPAHVYELLTAYVDNADSMAKLFNNLGALHSILEINWTGQAQVDYMDHLPENEGIRGRAIYPKDENGKLGYGVELIYQMESWALAHDITIHTNCEVTQILREGCAVTGVRALMGGQEYEFTARMGVIFGSGGYSHSSDLMLQMQRGPHFGGCSVPTNTGDFIRLGGAVGAKIGNTAGAFRAQSIIESVLENPDGSNNLFYLIGDSMLLVNKYGWRIMDEKRNYTDRAMLHFVWDPQKAEWTNMLTFMIFDQRCIDLWPGYPPFPAPGQDASYLIKADQLASLADEIENRLQRMAAHTGGFSLDRDFLPTLDQTIEQFNAYAHKGVDEEFQRGEFNYDREWTTFPPTVPGATWPPPGTDNYTMFPLSNEGPYYAIILAAGTLDTNGGPVIDGHGRVLDWENVPIPGLYGAGNCIASPTANAYWGAGSTIGPAMTFGYLAAKHAVDGTNN